MNSTPIEIANFSRQLSLAQFRQAIEWFQRKELKGHIVCVIDVLNKAAKL